MPRPCADPTRGGGTPEIVPRNRAGKHRASEPLGFKPPYGTGQTQVHTAIRPGRQSEPPTALDRPPCDQPPAPEGPAVERPAPEWPAPDWPAPERISPAANGSPRRQAVQPLCCSSGRSSGRIAPSTGQTCRQIPQSMQVSKSIQ